MSKWSSGYNPYMVVKENVEYKALFEKYADKVTESFVLDPPDVIQRYVDAFVMLIPSELTDEQFRNEYKNIIETWEKEQDVNELEYQDAISGANCPDILPKPSQIMDIERLRMIFIVARDLLYRRGLLMKKEVQDEV